MEEGIHNKRGRDEGDGEGESNWMRIKSELLSCLRS